MNGELVHLAERRISVGGLGELVVPALVAAEGVRVALRYVEFFAAQIRNPHTRVAYARAVGRFLAWCEEVSLLAIRPVHVAAWVEQQGQAHSAPTVKQQLAAIRMLFDWLVVGQVVPHNPAHAVKGPRHSTARGKRPGCRPATRPRRSWPPSRLTATWSACATAP